MQPSEKNKQKKRKVKNCIHGNRQTKQEWFRLRLIPYLEQKAKSDLQQQQQLATTKKKNLPIETNKREGFKFQRLSLSRRC